MKVSLTSDIQGFIERKVQSGQYASADEAVNALLAHTRAQEEMTPQDLKELRDAIDLGLAEADRGQFADFTAEDIIAEGHAARSKKKVS